MRYERPQHENKPSVDRVLDIVTYFLVVIIAFCFNYIVVNSLFR